MKKNFKYIIGILALGSIIACKKDLDINENPNTATSGTPELVLPQAIVSTAANVVTYNNSVAGSQVAGFYANSAGVSGWSAIISYNYQTSDGQNNWNNTFNTLNDVQYVLDKSEGVAGYEEFSAAAKVMKAYNYAMLVDLYNDVPYTEALKGQLILQPKYDDAKVIYKNITDLLDQAITTFKERTTPSKAFIAADPLFKGTLTTWAKFANTIKLRLVLKGKDKGVAFTNTTFDAVGFITDDAIVQPGYTKTEGKQNPMWNAWAYNAAGVAVGAASQYVPTPFVLAFYEGDKISDPVRGALMYKNYATAAGTSRNQLGYLPTTAETNTKLYSGLAPSNWFLGANDVTYDNIGILKGPDAGQPIMLAAEGFFLQAEANVKGLVTGTAKTNFETGIKASFKYLEKNASGAVTAGRNPETEFDAYKLRTPNVTSYLVDFDLATTNELKLEAIITQKYIAFNMLFGHEAFNEFKRTGYPKIVAGSTNDLNSFASIKSQSTAPDKLPTRIMYPESEFKYNAANIPSINKYSTKIFWAK